MKGSVCLCCYLQPCINMAFIYGIEPYISCNHNNMNPPGRIQKVLKKFYFGFIEFVLWQEVFIILWQLIPGLNANAPCIQGYQILKNGAMIFKLAMFVLAFVHASSFTFIKYNKISLEITLRSIDFCRQKMVQNSNLNARRLCLLMNFIVNCVIVWIQFVITYFLFSYIRKKEKFEGEALFCNVQMGIWVNFLIGGVNNNLLLSLMFVWIGQKEFQQIFNELALMKMDDKNLNFKLEKFIMHHEELWKWVNQMNNKYSYITVMIYFSITSGTSFCYYMYLFMELDNAVRYVVLGLVILLTFKCICYGFVLSSFAFNVSIRIDYIQLLILNS